jgi:hypothetical protein
LKVFLFDHEAERRQENIDNKICKGYIIKLVGAEGKRFSLYCIRQNQANQEIKPRHPHGRERI